MENEKHKEVFSKENYTLDYHLGRVHFAGKVHGKGPISDEDDHSLSGRKDLRRILNSVDEEGFFSIVPEDSHEYYVGAECSGKIESVTYSNDITYSMNPPINISFDNFLKIGKREVIRKVIQFIPIEDTSQYIA